MFNSEGAWPTFVSIFWPLLGLRSPVNKIAWQYQFIIKFFILGWPTEVIFWITVSSSCKDEKLLKRSLAVGMANCTGLHMHHLCIHLIVTYPCSARKKQWLTITTYYAKGLPCLTNAFSKVSSIPLNQRPWTNKIVFSVSSCSLNLATVLFKSNAVLALAKFQMSPTPSSEDGYNAHLPVKRGYSQIPLVYLHIRSRFRLGFGLGYFSENIWLKV